MENEIRSGIEEWHVRGKPLTFVLFIFINFVWCMRKFCIVQFSRLSATVMELPLMVTKH